MPEPITDDQRDLVSEVREALAKATPFGLSGRKSTESLHLIANAPSWLAALCEQVERLRNGSRCPECSATAWGEFGEARRELEIAQMERSDAIIRAEKAEAEIGRIRVNASPNRFACCACCPNDHPADSELTNNHEVACTICQDPWKARAEKAEAAVERVRALAVPVYLEAAVLAALDGE